MEPLKQQVKMVAMKMDLAADVLRNEVNNVFPDHVPCAMSEIRTLEFWAKQLREILDRQEDGK